MISDNLRVRQDSKLADPKEKTILTERLRLVPLSLDDSESYTKYFNNINVIKRFSFEVALPFSLENAIEDINHYCNSDHISFGIKLNTNPQELIGMITFYQDELTANKYWLGYWLGEPFWNKRIMTEVMKGCLNYLFCQEDVESIGSIVDYDNIASIKIMNNFKFRFVEIVNNDHHINCTEETVDCNYYELTKNEYLKHFSN